MPRVISKRLGELLRQKGVITEAELQKALGVQKEERGLSGEILVRLGFAEEEGLT